MVEKSENVTWLKDQGILVPAASLPQVTSTSPKKTNPWPSPLTEEAYHGLAGDIVRAIAPHTESDPASLMVQLLVAFGNVVGREPCWMAEADRHGTNLMTVIVGDSAKARKGTSWGHILKLMTEIDPGWRRTCLKSGLSSGEGLIYHVRDPGETAGDEGGDRKASDLGVEDKRLCILETEFASVLNRFRRDGNTLSAVIRDAWDGRTLSTLTKNSPLTATDPHISIVAHITGTELLKCLNETEQANGLGNRFIWVCAKRTQLLPEGGKVSAEVLDGLTSRLRAVLEFSQVTGEIKFDEEARSLWHAIYPRLSESVPGLLGSMTARSEAQVRRLATIYALLDRSQLVCEYHLRAGVEVWRYAEDSCRHIFGVATGDNVADSILTALRSNPTGLTRTEIIRDVFGGNKGKVHIDRGLSLLEKNGLAKHITETPPEGRPIERWFAVA